MAPSKVETLANHLQDRYDRLRSAAYYSDDGYELLYLRDDVAEMYSNEDVDEVYEHLWMGAFGKTSVENLYVHEDLRCIAHYFADAVEINLLLGDNQGVAVAFEAGAISDQQEFVADCREILDS